MPLVFNKQRDLKISGKAAKKLIAAVLACQKRICGDVAVYFVSEQKICQVHEQFFQDPSPTDCISFPLEADPLAGEIFVCPQTAVLYAEKRGLDPYEEVALYIIHGLLHLLGHEDATPEGRRTMRKKEKSCMREINRLNISLRP